MGKLKDVWEHNDGPIPGENFTSNTKNYPWHRPPEIKDLEDGVDLFIKKMVGDKKRANGLITLVEMGIPISTLVDIIVTQGISAGKWTPDFALMLAGPIARIIEMMARGAGVKDYVKGWEDDSVIPTKTFFDNQSSKSIKEFDLARAKREALKTAEEVKNNDTSTGMGGLGSKPPAKEIPVEEVL